MKLIKNTKIYAPEYLGIKDIFIAGGKICAIANELSLAKDLNIEIIDGSNKILVPGFIDSHVHVLGGGGEGGFSNRTPEATLSNLTKCGITTVVGCLGTDGFARDIRSLVAKLKSLKEQGLSAFGYTGSYQIPIRTLTDNVTQDIMFIDEIIGAGEIALSDHRSSQPTFEEFARLCADVRVGGILSGKSGIINIHLGAGPSKLELIKRIITETEIPASQFLPTHVNRNASLFDDALEFAKAGGTIDFTGNCNPNLCETSDGEVLVSKGIRRLLDEGIDDNRFTISSDGQGSLPEFDKNGKFIKMGIGDSTCLLKEIKECVFNENIPLEIAIKAITSNPAHILGLKNKGQIKEGLDADLCLLHHDLTIDTVIAKGQIMVRNTIPTVHGLFE